MKTTTKKEREEGSRMIMTMMITTGVYVEEHTFTYILDLYAFTVAIITVVITVIITVAIITVIITVVITVAIVLTATIITIIIITIAIGDENVRVSYLFIKKLSLNL